MSKVKNGNNGKENNINQSRDPNYLYRFKFWILGICQLKVAMKGTPFIVCHLFQEGVAHFRPNRI